MARRRAKRKRSTLEIFGFVTIGAFVVAIIWLAFFTSPQTPGQTTTLGPAPDFTLTDVDGKLFRLSDYRGKIVVIEFMRMSCPACINQEPYLAELRSRFGSDVVMVMISVDPAGDTIDILRSHRDQSLAGWIAIRDTAQIYNAYSVQATPTIFIIDKNGHIQFRHDGVTESTVLINEVQKLTE